MHRQMTNYVRFCWFRAICGRIYGQKWPNLWPNKIAGMAMAMVAMPDFTSMAIYYQWTIITAASPWSHSTRLSVIWRHYDTFLNNCHHQILSGVHLDKCALLFHQFEGSAPPATHLTITSSICLVYFLPWLRSKCSQDSQRGIFLQNCDH